MRLGIFLEDMRAWTGGLYYILNLISALKTLGDERPAIVVFYRSQEDIEAIKKIDYGNLAFFRVTTNYLRLKRWLGRLDKNFHRNSIYQALFRRYIVDVVFPNAYHIFTEIENHIFWIPDFQEKYYPEFFSTEELKSRESEQTFFASRRGTIVFSSYDAMGDFKKFYPNASAKSKVVQFAVTHPEFQADLTFAECRKKYRIDGPYFITLNQFWRHKNHLTLIDAIEQVVRKYPDCNFIFTGKEVDSRDPYFPSIVKETIRRKQLEKNIRTLGFIDREHALTLVKYAHAVIQPSLFEGWSTVVEDAKALGTLVIASDLEVHKEQLEGNALYFDRTSASDLAEKIQIAWEQKKVVPDYNYKEAVQRFALNFNEILRDIQKNGSLA